MRKIWIITLAILLIAAPASAESNIIIKSPGKEQCGIVIQSLKTEMDHGNYCRDDSECIAVPLGCPLPCNPLMNINEPITRITALKETYDRICGSCDKGCAEPKGDPVCVKHKCVYQ